jgi:Flp pilus assembly secretin CpaC
MRPIYVLLASAIAISTPVCALAAPLAVPVDQVRKVPFAGLASSVSPGNPAIADVNVVDEQTILVVGKKPGVTNLVIMDRAGRTLFNDRIVVSASGGLDSVQISRGGKTTAYACAPYCMTLNPGAVGGGER